MMIQDESLTIQQVARLTGLSVHTLRYYERINLIHPIDRAGNTHRRYTTEDVGWIEFLTRLRQTGMPIRQMRLYAELQRQGEGTLPQRLAMLKDLQDTVKAHMKVLQENLSIIDYKVEFYSEIVARQQAEKA